jgi:hypothetical protein
LPRNFASLGMAPIIAPNEPILLSPQHTLSTILSKLDPTFPV